MTENKKSTEENSNNFLSKLQSVCLPKLLRLGKGFLALLPKSSTEYALSIDFGVSSVKICLFKVGINQFELLAYDIQRIDNLENSSDLIITAVKNFISANSVSVKTVNVSLQFPRDVIIKNVTLPPLPKKEVIGAAKLQINEEVAFSLEEAIIDWQVIREYKDETETKKQDILFTIAETKVVQQYLLIIKKCGLFPGRVSIGPFNYSNILKSFPNPEQICAVLDVGHINTTLAIYCNNQLQFVRELNFSSSKLTQSLTGTLMSTKGKIEISESEAEKIKEEFGIPCDEEKITIKNIRGVHIISLMRPLLEGLIRDLQNSFDYYSVSAKENGPSALYLTGGGANLKTFDAYLARELNIAVSDLKAPSSIVFSENLSQAEKVTEFNQLLSSFGAICCETVKVDLLPPEIKIKKVEAIEKISLRIAALIAGSVLGASLIFLSIQKADYKNRLDNAKRHLQTTGRIKSLKDDIRAWENLSNQVFSDKFYFDSILKVVSIEIPDAVVLSEMILSQGRGNVVLTGRIENSSDLAEDVLVSFMEKLEKTPLFKEAVLLFSRRTVRSHEFQIECRFSK
ncbi:MAG: pilus assembly protein PilM [Candidatus Omnitrophica bacterium]|nr:pilus assembly protein PilM [Candidatus Omnitrophota bacterium]